MKVRLAGREEAEIVGELLDEATRWVGARGFEQWPLPFPREQLLAGIDRGEVYIVERDGRPAGTVTLLWDDPPNWGERPPDAVYVHKLAVRREHAGKGIGADVVAWADRRAAAAGRAFLRLDCLADNAAIRSYYETLGFEHRGDIELEGRRMSLYERSVRP